MKIKLLNESLLASVIAATIIQPYQSANAAPPPPRFSVPVDDLEVLGPFSNWGNVKTRYGAAGDGQTDDTIALQNALNDLSKTDDLNTPPVIYLPAGVYVISSTLKLNGAFSPGTQPDWGGVSIIGEDPATTKIIWNGPSGVPMLIQDGGFNTRYSRITWDGNGIAEYGVAHWWDATNHTYHGGSPEHTDEIFKNMAIGIMAGRMNPGRTATKYGEMDSEGQVRRVRFSNISKAAINVGSFNALDWWVWDSYFENCERGASGVYSVNDEGIQYEPGAGGINVYRSTFIGSRTADYEIRNTGRAWWSLHHNVSKGAPSFFKTRDAGNNGGPIIINNNRVIDSTGASISNGTLGPLLIIDNQFSRKSGNNWSPVNIATGVGWPDVLSINNKFTASPPYIRNQYTDAYARIRSIGDTTVAASVIDSDTPQPPVAPTRSIRQVYEAEELTEAAIQNAINDAASSGLENPIVHIPQGKYEIKNGLVIPSRSRIQIVGDGLKTILRRTEPQNLTNLKPIIQLKGPSYATLRDLQIYSMEPNNRIAAININNADQSSGRIFIIGSSPGDIRASRLLQTQLTMQANTNMGRVHLYAAKNVVSIGAGGDGPNVYLGGNSSAFVADSWYEGYQTKLFRLNSGQLTYMGGHMAPYASTPETSAPGIGLPGFAGRTLFVGMSMNLDNLQSSPKIGIGVSNESSETEALFMGIAGSQPDYFSRGSGGRVGLASSKVSGLKPDGSGTGLFNALVADSGTTDDGFIDQMLSQTRALIWEQTPYAPSAGATDVRIYRVKANQSGGIAITGRPQNLSSLD